MLRHLAVIMDGNGRYGQKIGLSRNDGYKFGAEALCKALVDFIGLPIEVLSVYAFSTENFKRNNEEVSNILNVIAYFLKNKIYPIAVGNHITVRFIGDLDALPFFLKEVISIFPDFQTEKTLVIAINYGGDDEIVRTVKRIFDKNEQVTVQSLKENSDTAFLPDPDAVLRYGGYKRLSNFLPLQTTYSELFFIDKLWPEYEQQDFNDVLSEFKQIKRNFGV